MNNMNKIFCLVFGVLMLIGMVSALPIYVTPLDSGVMQTNSSFDYVFNFTNSSDCSGVILSNSTTIATNRYGVGFVDLDVSGLSSRPSYMCEYRNGTLRKVHNFSDMVLGKIWSSELVVGSGVSVGGNVTANAFIGDGSQLTGVGGSNSSFNQSLTDSLYVPYTGANSNVVIGNNNFSVNSSTLFVDSGTGRVGIGTTGPGTTLDVIGDVRASNRLYVGSGTGVYINTAGFFSAGNWAFASVGGVLTLANNDNNPGRDLTFKTRATERMRIDSEGNVGIGTTSPSYKFSVSSDGIDQLGMYTTASNSWITWTDGNLIITTDEGTNTDTNLDIQGKGTGSAILKMNSNSLFRHVDETTVLDIVYTGNQNVSFGSDLAEGETPITSFYGYRTGDSKRNMNMGISADVDDTFYFNNVGNYVFDGNVGIGTTSPTLGKLQVNGGIYSDNFRTDETTAHTVFVGDDTGGTGTYSTFVGEHAGGDSNVDYSNALGYQALQSNTGASSNAVGHNALQSNTGAYSNAVGHAALQSNDGDYNTALGDNAFNNWTDDTARAEVVDSIDHTTERVTITGHGFGAIGTKLNLVATTTGTLPTGLSADAQQWEVIDANTLECKTDSFTDAGTGTMTLTPKVVYTNSLALGYNAEPDASNQAVIGNSALTQVKTAGAIYSTSTGNNYFAGNIGIGTTSPTSKLSVNGSVNIWLG